MTSTPSPLLPPSSIVSASQRLNQVVVQTPLMESINYSEKYGCKVWFKREDLQLVRSYKLRGAYNRMSLLTSEERQRGIVCASAGNHAQGVAYSCLKLQVHGKIFMPITTPKQKVSKVKMFGKDWVEIVLVGDTYDDAYRASMVDMEQTGSVFVHPFDHEAIIAGQGTVGLEVLNQMQEKIDYVFLAIGGGGLAAGVGSYLKQLSPNTRIIGVEPTGAPAMHRSLEQGKVVQLDTIDKFVDGAAVQRVGDIPFRICKEAIDEMALVDEGKVCSVILQLYNEDAIVVEPAGALSIAILDDYKAEIKGKNVVCIISGGNNDIMRTEEIKERSLVYEGLKHYFLIRFPQRAGALREFLAKVLGPTDDITRFEYIKKTNKENAPAFVGIEVAKKEDYELLIQRMEENGIIYQAINENPTLFNLLV